MSSAIILNYFLAWLCALLTIFLSSKYLFRKLVQKSVGKKKAKFVKINQGLKLPHIILGFTMLAAGLIHGLNSSQPVWSLNTGTLCFSLCLLLTLSWLVRSQFKKAMRWRLIHNVLAVCLIGVLVWHVVDHGGIRVFRALELEQQITLLEEERNSEVEPAPPAAPDSAAATPTVTPQEDDPFARYFFAFDGLDLQDGTYEVTAKGYSEGLVVSVTVLESKVTAIEIVSHHEMDAKYFQPAFDMVPSAIVDQQTLDVDAVTGSTMTTMGIINGVRDAVLQAAGRDDLI